MISALPVAIDASRTRITAGPVISPAGVQLVHDVGHPQQPVEADRREQQAEQQQDDADDVDADHQNGRRG